MSPRARAALVAAFLAVGTVVVPASSPAQPDEPMVGKPLATALSELADQGLRLVYTTELVTPDLVVEQEPQARQPRQMLREILRPHGLDVEPGPGGTLVVVRLVAEPQPLSLRGMVRTATDGSPLGGARLRVLESGTETLSDSTGRFELPMPAGATTLEISRFGFLTRRLQALDLTPSDAQLVIELEAGPMFEEELTVTPSHLSLLRDTPVAPMAIGRQEILGLPHLADDFYRALSLLPGVTSNDVTAQFHVRGGRRDETRILLDGQELYDAYHLKDFDSAMSLVASSTLESADLTTGGFAVEHGDRMSAVLDMRTLRPSGRTRGRIALGVLSAGAGGHGSFSEGRGAWLAEARRGTIDLVSQLLGHEDPTYWDGYGKLDYQLDPRHRFGGHVLVSGDDLGFARVDGPDSKDISTEYDSRYGWLDHQLLASDRLLVESGLSWARIERERLGLEIEEDVAFSVRDVRRSDIAELRQSWSLEAGNHLLRWGLELRRFDTRYDYLADFTFDNPLAEIRTLPDSEPTIFERRFDERHDSLYLTDRLPITDTLSLEAGLRYDEHSQTDEHLLSPRLNLALALGERSTVRLAWGRFAQSQRPYELQIQDGETAFHRVERSEHFLLGSEHLIQRPKGDLTLRAEIYRREISAPRPRYENLYEALNTFPEVEPDRVRIAPDRTVIEGLELFLRGPSGRRLGWWINYTYAEARDVIGGARVWRAFDQRHSLNLDLDLAVGPNWRLNLAWRFRTGWPSTPLAAEAELDEEGEIRFVPSLGPLYSQRLPDYHRLDMRAKRDWQIGGVTLGLYIDVQNLYDRRNLAGFDVEIDEDEGTVVLTREDWAGILPSAGVTLEF